MDFAIQAATFIGKILGQIVWATVQVIWYLTKILAVQLWRLFIRSDLSKTDFWHRQLSAALNHLANLGGLLGQFSNWLFGILRNRAGGGTWQNDPPMPSDLSPYFPSQNIHGLMLRPLAAAVQITVPTHFQPFNPEASPQMEKFAAAAGRGIFMHYGQLKPPQVFNKFMDETSGDPVEAFRKFARTYNLNLTYLGSVASRNRLSELVTCLLSIEDLENGRYSALQVTALDRILRQSVERFKAVKAELDRLLALEREVNVTTQQLAFAAIASFADEARESHIQLVNGGTDTQQTAQGIRYRFEKLRDKLKRVDQIHREFSKLASDADTGDPKISAIVSDFEGAMGKARSTTDLLELDRQLPRFDQLHRQLKDIKELLPVRIREFFTLLGLAHVSKESEVPPLSTVKVSFRDALLKVHPDRTRNTPEQNRLTREVNAAWDALRAEYKKRKWKM